MTERRLRQANLIGPAGFISMEDGAATGFVQRAVRAAPTTICRSSRWAARHRLRRKPRHRSRRARLLERLSRAHGHVGSEALAAA